MRLLGYVFLPPGAARFAARACWRQVGSAKPGRLFALVRSRQLGEVGGGRDGGLLMDPFSAPHLVPQMNRIGFMGDERDTCDRVRIQERLPLPPRNRAKDGGWFDCIVRVGLLDHARDEFGAGHAPRQCARVLSVRRLITETGDRVARRNSHHGVSDFVRISSRLACQNDRRGEVEWPQANDIGIDPPPSLFQQEFVPEKVGVVFYPRPSFNARAVGQLEKAGIERAPSNLSGSKELRRPRD